MDSVRFGRVLGLGARHAVKTLVTAVDAATTENPSRNRQAGSHEPGRPHETRAQAVGRTVQQGAGRVREAQLGLKRGGRRFGETAWRLSGVLWLEVTGVFFGMFMVFAAANAWKERANWQDAGVNHAGHRALLWSIGMAAVFGYFCVSSFVRARRRERHR